MRHVSALALFAASILGAPLATQAGIPTGAEVQPLAPATVVDFEVYLPLRNKAGLARLLAEQQTAGSANYRRWLTPAQFGTLFGPTPAQMADLKARLAAAGLQVTATHTRSVHVEGAAADVGKFLSTHLTQVTRSDGSQDIVADTHAVLPASLRAEGAVIVAFTGLPPYHTDSKIVTGPSDVERDGPYGPYNYDDLKQAYDYPSYQSTLANGNRLDGTGVNVAVLMETAALNTDIADMFNHEKFSTTTGLKNPVITVLKVDGGAPFNKNNGASTEASLDVQQVLGGAPGATVTLLSLPDLSDAHVLDGYTTIVEQNTWEVATFSAGGCELLYTAPYNNGVDETSVLTALDEELAQGSSQGITFIASSGDSGALACPTPAYLNKTKNTKFVVGVESPADDPNITAVGGGNLETTAPSGTTLTATYVAENGNGDPETPYDPLGVGVNVSGGYWGAGGGVSTIFAEPAYQLSLASATGRIVPDVGMLVGGCPGIAVQPCPSDLSSVIVTVAGVREAVIGTSVAAPEFAGAVALFVESSGQRVGNLNTWLWALSGAQDSLGGASAPTAARFFHKTIVGFDGHFHQTSADPFGYVDGNGTPDVRVLFQLTAFAPAGEPRSATNP